MSRENFSFFEDFSASRQLFVILVILTSKTGSRCLPKCPPAQARLSPIPGCQPVFRLNNRSGDTAARRVSSLDILPAFLRCWMDLSVLIISSPT